MHDILERRTRLREVGLTTLRELETERGILASGRSEIYGCIFGRDSLITSLKLLKAYRKTGDPYFLAVVKKVLLNLIALQGKEVNIESGEEPGKCIHEYRPDNHEHLTKNAVNPWYVYPDNVMRNYDTVDATPLLLIVTHEYWRASGDEEFLQGALPAVYAALDWIFNYGDGNGDGFIDYRFDPQRKHGGLVTQSWMDSAESLFHDDGAAVPYPVAPVEVQAYTYVALRAWGAYFSGRVPERAAQLDTHAADLKRRFNERFVVQSERGTSLAFALDGNGRPLTAARSSMGHCLWAVWNDGAGGLASILEAHYIPAIVERLLMPDLFEPLAGIRTLSTDSARFDPNSYHNGSIWPHDTAITLAGLENFGYQAEAERVREAMLAAYEHFQTPLELFAYTAGAYQDYCGPNGQAACKTQAWSAAALVAEALAEVRKE